MAKGILRAQPKKMPKGILKHDDIMKKTTPEQRMRWAHDYVRGFVAAQTMMKKMKGM